MIGAARLASLGSLLLACGPALFACGPLGEPGPADAAADPVRVGIYTLLEDGYDFELREAEPADIPVVQGPQGGLHVDVGLWFPEGLPRGRHFYAYTVFVDEVPEEETRFQMFPMTAEEIGRDGDFATARVFVPINVAGTRLRIALRVEDEGGAALTPAPLEGPARPPVLGDCGVRCADAACEEGRTFTFTELAPGFDPDGRFITTCEECAGYARAPGDTFVGPPGGCAE